MLTYEIKKGTTSRIISFPVYDSSSSVGALLSGLLYNTSSLVCYYDRTGSSGSPTSVTLATMTKGTWASGGFIAKGTGMVGWYDFGIPDAAIASGADEVILMLSGAANMVPVSIRIKLVDNEEMDTYSIVNGDHGLVSIQDDIDTLLSRIIGTLASGTHNPQSGDGYSIVNSGTYGLSAIKAIIDAILADTGTDGVVVASGSKSGYSLSTTPPTAAEIVTAILAGTYGDSTLKFSDLLVILSGIFGGKMTSTLDETQSGIVTFYNRANEAVVTATFVNGARTAVTWNKVS